MILNKEDRQALAYSLRQPSLLWRSGHEYVEYIADDMKVADSLQTQWTSTDSLLTSSDSLQTSNDSLSTSTDSN